MGQSNLHVLYLKYTGIWISKPLLELTEIHTQISVCYTQFRNDSVTLAVKTKSVITDSNVAI